MLPSFSPEQITGAVSVIDRLISLLKTRDENNQHIIEKIVDPYFSELQTAYSAYLATLRTIKEAVDDGQPYPAIYKKVKPIRAADLIIRDKVREMAATYGDGLSAHADIATFFEKAHCLFGYWNGYHHSGTLRILDALLNKSSVHGRKFLAESVEMTIDAGEEQWRELASLYASIRLKYLQPVKTAVSRNSGAQIQRRPLARLLNAIRGLLPSSHKG